MPFDLAVVGSGGAGFAAAIAARRRGLSVVMVEQGRVGDIGCVPSKALLAAAQARQVALTTASLASRRWPARSTWAP